MDFSWLIGGGTLAQAGLAALIGYALGSIPFGLLISALGGQGDIRKIGSGNIGATNALRTGKKWIAALTLAGDVGKAVAAILIVRALLHHDLGIVAAVAAFLGHLYPVWIGFKGGKGVATFVGITLTLAVPLGLAVSVVWALTLALFRFSSLASLNAAAMAPILAFGMGYGRFVVPLALLAVLIFLRHRENIARLMKGEEPKVGKPKT